jgi:hypothetical protein
MDHGFILVKEQLSCNLFIRGKTHICESLWLARKSSYKNNKVL